MDNFRRAARAKSQFESKKEFSRLRVLARQFFKFLVPRLAIWMSRGIIQVQF